MAHDLGGACGRGGELEAVVGRVEQMWRVSAGRGYGIGLALRAVEARAGLGWDEAAGGERGLQGLHGEGAVLGSVLLSEGGMSRYWSQFRQMTLLPIT